MTSYYLKKLSLFTTRLGFLLLSAAKSILRIEIYRFEYGLAPTWISAVGESINASRLGVSISGPGMLVRWLEAIQGFMSLCCPCTGWEQDPSFLHAAVYLSMACKSFLFLFFWREYWTMRISPGPSSYVLNSYSQGILNKNMGPG